MEGRHKRRCPAVAKEEGDCSKRTKESRGRLERNLRSVTRRLDASMSCNYYNLTKKPKRDKQSSSTALGKSHVTLANTVDDDNTSALSSKKQPVLPHSNMKYAAELQLQQVILPPCIGPTSPQTRSPPPRTIKEKGECSKSASTSRRLFCKICLDKAPAVNMFRNNNCTHSFCRDCLSRYIGAKVEENIPSVECPEIECKGVFEPEYCREIISREVLERWEAALCEAMILGSQKFYCPFKDCSALLVDDGNEPVMQAECPNCHRLFCAQCKVAWHAGLSCTEHKKLGFDMRGKEDLLLMDIVEKKKWKRCPKCKFFVGKNGGCMHITCRCGYQFCYRCGLQWEITHEGTCSTSLRTAHFAV